MYPIKYVLNMRIVLKCRSTKFYIVPKLISTVYSNLRYRGAICIDAVNKYVITVYKQSITDGTLSNGKFSVANSENT